MAVDYCGRIRQQFRRYCRNYKVLNTLFWWSFDYDVLYNIIHITNSNHRSSDKKVEGVLDTVLLMRK